MELDAGPHSIIDIQASRVPDFRYARNALWDYYKGKVITKSRHREPKLCKNIARANLSFVIIPEAWNSWCLYISYTSLLVSLDNFNLSSSDLETYYFQLRWLHPGIFGFKMKISRNGSYVTKLKQDYISPTLVPPKLLLWTQPLYITKDFVTDVIHNAIFLSWHLFFVQRFYRRSWQ
jgi:hypothetical protein